MMPSVSYAAWRHPGSPGGTGTYCRAAAVRLKWVSFGVKDRAMAASSSIDSAHFSVTCAQCGAKVSAAVGEQRERIPCGCGAEVDLTTEEARHARAAAAAHRSIDTHQGSGT